MSVSVQLFRLHEREISHCGIPSAVDPRCLACLDSQHFQQGLNIPRDSIMPVLVL